jgi:hypothetical protein
MADPGYTRRQFFAQLGIAFAALALGSLPVETGGGYPVEATGTWNISTIDSILKEMYLPAIQKQLNSSDTLYNLMRRGGPVR